MTIKEFYQACKNGDVETVSKLKSQHTPRTVRRGILTAAVHTKAAVINILMTCDGIGTRALRDIAFHACATDSQTWFPDLIEAMGDDADCKFYLGTRLTTLRKTLALSPDSGTITMKRSFKPTTPWDE